MVLLSEETLDKDNPDTPPSAIGVLGWVTENGSKAVGVGGNFNLLNDYVRIDAAAGYVDMNYHFYGIGSDAGNKDSFVDVNQEMPIYYINAKYQVFHRGYLGLGFLGGLADTRITSSNVSIPPEFPGGVQSIRIAGIEVPFQYDTRDNQLYPRAGLLVDASGVFYRQSVGSDFNSESYAISANSYYTIRQRDVLALRASLQMTGDDAPFYLQSSIGGRQDMRGYEFGRYVDRMAYALQAEYRWQLDDKWIATGFTGVAEVAPTMGAFLNDYLPAAGVGARYVLSKKYNVNLALDVAVGRNGTHYYLTLGEAF